MTLIFPVRQAQLLLLIADHYYDRYRPEWVARAVHAECNNRVVCQVSLVSNGATTVCYDVRVTNISVVKYSPRFSAILDIRCKLQPQTPSTTHYCTATRSLPAPLAAKPDLSCKPDGATSRCPRHTHRYAAVDVVTAGIYSMSEL